MGSQPNQASQVRLSDVVEDGDNTFVEMTLPASEEAQEGETETIKIAFTHQEGHALALPKYNPDGARYLYGAREYLTGGSHYEQVFGQVGEDGSVTGDKVPAYEEGQLVEGVRQDGDDLVYTGGILSNRRTNTATAQVTKIWQAAAYQANFEDVAVEFTLYQQAKGEGAFTPSDSAQPVMGEDRKPVTYVLHDFSAEHLTDSGAVSGLPLYDAQGQELEYFWKETAVYQGVDVPTTASQDRVKAALSQEGATKHQVENGQFTLTQAQAVGEAETEVAYHAVTEYKSGSTVVTNKIQDQVEFAIKKYWENENGETVEPQDDVTFHIYQTLAGNDFNFSAPYVTVTIPKDEGQKPFLAEGAPEGVSLTSESGDIDRFNERNEPSNTDWDCIVQNLPKFDETGHLYSYFLLEAEDEHGQGYVPSYVNNYYPESGDYSSVITNAPGDPTVIMVQKNWIDDGDALHRDPVKVGVYYSENGALRPLKKDGEPVTKTMDGSSGSWTEFISFDLPENVALTDLYVVELTVGSGAVDHGHSGEEGNLPTVAEWEAGHAAGDENKIFSVSTDYHRYQVTYETQVKPNAAVPVNVDALYTVTNRRLGAIDVKVEKTWLSGGQGEEENQGIAQLVEAMEAANTDEKQYALAFQLDFASGQDNWNITNNGGNDTVTVGSEAVPITGEDGKSGAASLQVILGPEDDQPVSEFSFYSLPKYDEDGAVVSYQVREVWVTKSADGTAWKVIENNELPEELRKVWGQYTASYQTQYVVGTDGDTEPGDAPLRDRDTQTVSVTNRRGDVKDVTWYKEWRDHFADGNGNAPFVIQHLIRIIPGAVFVLLAGNPDQVLVKAANRHGTFFCKEVIQEAEGNPWRLIRRSNEGIASHAVGFQLNHGSFAVRALYGRKGDVLIAYRGEKVVRGQAEHAAVTGRYLADGHITGLGIDFIVHQAFGVHGIHILKDLFPFLRIFQEADSTVHKLDIFISHIVIQAEKS